MRESWHNREHLLGAAFIILFAALGIMTIVLGGYFLNAYFLPIAILNIVYVFIGVTAWKTIMRHPRTSFSLFYFTTQTIVTLSMNLIIKQQLDVDVPPFWDFGLIFQAGVLGWWQWIICLLLAGVRLYGEISLGTEFSQLALITMLYLGFVLAGYLFSLAYRTRQQLSQLMSQIEQAHELDLQRFEKIHSVRQNFLRAATHDLKTPLNVFLGFLQLLEEDAQIQQHKQAPEYINRMSRSANHMNQLIQDMLDLLEVQSDIQPKFARVPLNRLIEQIAIDMTAYASKHQVYVHVDFPADAVYARVDPHMFQRMLNNLLTNAVKFTPPEGSVTVALEEQVESIDVHVTDTGMGIPESEVPRLFEPFTRVEAESYRKIEGTGLGLAIVKAIAEQHNATISVETMLNMGTTITVSFPR